MVVSTIIKPGTRLAVFGRSGSGKTYFEKWSMLRSRMKWIVLDSKHDNGFDDWTPEKGLIPMSRIGRLWADKNVVVIRPSPIENKPEFLDTYLGELHDAFDGFGVCIDETYQVALGSKPGAGLTGLVTRGRARKQSVILGSQRPAWVPQFCFSEANAMVIMSLTLEADRKKVFQNTGQIAVMYPVPPRVWLYYDVASNEMTRYSAVTITG